MSAHPHSSAPVVPGQILAGKYRVERVLGQGGMGVVVEARHTALDDRVALKFLLPEYAATPEASGRFLREARAAVKIKNEHVARVSDVGTLEGGEPYMVMEYLEGSDLSQQLQRYGPLALFDAVDFVIQACEAIAEAHSYEIVHRDLKPANLFLTKHHDGSPLIKVLDFGISKMSGQGVDQLTRTSTAMGSALYMSPEQMQQARSVDHRTDIYALGVTVYELLGGKQPYYADTLPQLCAEILTGIPTPLLSLRPDLPEDFARVLERAYARDREHRYPSIADFVFALAPYAPPRSQPSIDRVGRMAGRQPPRAGEPSSGALGRASAPSYPGATGPLPGAPQTQPSAGHQLVVGPYEAPSSQKATVAFASGGTNANLTTSGAAQIPTNRTGIWLLVALGALGVGGAAAFFGYQHMTKPGPSTGAEAATSQAADPETTGAADTSATADATADPAVDAPTADAGAAAEGGEPGDEDPATKGGGEASATETGTASGAKPPPPTQVKPPPPPPTGPKTGGGTAPPPPPPPPPPKPDGFGGPW